MERQRKPDRVFEFHETDWPREHVERFWTFYAQHTSREETYFSKIHAEAILRVLRQDIELKGIVVDVGCGNGYLIERCLKEGLECIGIDTSPQSVEFVRQRLGDKEGFRGAYTGVATHVPLKDETADIVFLLEVLEHLRTEDVLSVMAEMKRITRPTGHIIITVPHAEDLEASKVACPECGCAFHRMQHIQSFTVDRLREILIDTGIDIINVFATDLSLYKRPTTLQIISSIRNMLGYPTNGHQPHLIAIGRRPLIPG